HVTGVQTCALPVAGGALAAGVTVPIAHAAGLGWAGVLASWALFALLALVCWLPHVRRAGRPVRVGGVRVGGLWRDAIAWQVTLYMGLQALSHVAVTGWLPAMPVERGFDPVAAGFPLAPPPVSGTP